MKETGGVMSDQYFDAGDSILEDVSAEEYRKRQEWNMNEDDFIVGDDGYKDHGGEIWDYEDETY